LKKYSVGVRCTWQVASWEAAAAKNTFIEPEHLLIGLFSLDKVHSSSLFMSLSEPEKKQLQLEQIRLNKVVRDLNISPADIRRRLRGKLPHKHFSANVKIIHRSGAAKNCFTYATQLANNSSEIDILILLAAIMSYPGKRIEQEFANLGVPCRSVWIKALAYPNGPTVPAEEGISGSDFASIQTFTKHNRSSKLTIMFDDIVGSMALYHKLGDDEFLKLIQYHDETIKHVIKRKGQGEIIKSTGDGLLMVFSNPAIAVECALDIQKEFLSHNLLKIRIGMDMGEVKQVGDEKSRDIFGIRVSSANRIMCAAEGGHVLTSKAVFEEAQNKKSGQPASWKYLGSRSFKPGEPIIEVYEVYDPQIHRSSMKELPVEVLTDTSERPTATGLSRSLLDRFGRDFSVEAAEGKLGPYAERRNEILQVIQTLVQRYCNNPLLIGKAGVGKSALVEAVALKLNQSKNLLPKKRIIELNMNLLMAGVK
jgi:class 3 adenylate cyclase